MEVKDLRVDKTGSALFEFSPLWQTGQDAHILIHVKFPRHFEGRHLLLEILMEK
jgi:hypothetical protein